MGRPLRFDEPGLWHHVMNRGIGKRTAFARAKDIRYFLSRVAQAVRRREIDVHAYCVLPSHFHMLVSSPRGELSEGMRRIQNEHSRAVNRRLRRDGALFRGRFTSKTVTSDAYRRILVRYIDWNAARAGIAATPWRYPFCSARAYVMRRSGPVWLNRSWIEAEACAAAGADVYLPSCYATAFAPDFSEDLREVVERRLAYPATGPDPLDDLVRASPQHVREWMERKARRADGTSADIPIASPASVDRAIAEARERFGIWDVCLGRKRICGWTCARVALLRVECGMTFKEIAIRLGIAPSTAQYLWLQHARAFAADAEYSRRSTALVQHSLDDCHRIQT